MEVAGRGPLGEDPSEDPCSTVRKEAGRLPEASVTLRPQTRHVWVFVFLFIIPKREF